MLYLLVDRASGKMTLSKIELNLTQVKPRCRESKRWVLYSFYGLFELSNDLFLSFQSPTNIDVYRTTLPTLPQCQPASQLPATPPQSASIQLADDGLSSCSKDYYLLVLISSQQGVALAKLGGGRKKRKKERREEESCLWKTDRKKSVREKKYRRIFSNIPLPSLGGLNQYLTEWSCWFSIVSLWPAIASSFLKKAVTTNSKEGFIDIDQEFYFHIFISYFYWMSQGENGDGLVCCSGWVRERSFIIRHRNTEFCLWVEFKLFDSTQQRKCYKCLLLNLNLIFSIRRKEKTIPHKLIIIVYWGLLKTIKA